MEHKLSIDTNFVTIGHIEAEILWPTLYYSLYPEQYIPHIPDISVGQFRFFDVPFYYSIPLNQNKDGKIVFRSRKQLK